MGKSASGGGTRRAGRRMGAVVAVVAGATVLAGAAAAAVAGRRRRERATATADDHRARRPAALAGEAAVPAAPAADSAAAVAPVDEDVAAWASAVTAPRATPVDAVEASGPAPGGAAGAPRVDEPEAALRLAADITPIGELSVTAVTDAVRRAWSADGNGAVAGPVPASDAAPHGDAPPLASRASRSAGAGRAAGSQGPAPAAAGRRPWMVVAGVVALVLALALGVAVLSGGGGGGDGDRDVETASEADDPVPPSQVTTVPTTVPTALTAADAFPATAERLNAAGSFSYAGTVSATDVSHVRPMLWLSVESTVEGQVALAAGRLREVAVAGDGRAAETVTDGMRVLGRRADVREDLAGMPFELVPALSGEGPAARGAALLPTWLASAVAPAEAGPDETGRRRFTATIPGSVLGQIERQREPVDATVLLTVDASGAPVRVEITSSPAGPPLHLVFDLSGLGAPVDIQPPA